MRSIQEREIKWQMKMGFGAGILPAYLVVILFWHAGRAHIVL